MDVKKLLEEIQKLPFELENAQSLYEQTKEKEISELKEELEEAESEIRKLKQEIIELNNLVEKEHEEYGDLQMELEECQARELTEEEIINALKKRLKSGSRWFREEFYELAEQSILV